MRLSQYFTTEELECKCSCGAGSDPSHYDPALIIALTRMREQRGKPIIVTSGARCPQHNEDEKGGRNSAHLTTVNNDVVGLQCRAVDILVFTGHERDEIMNIAHDVGIVRRGIAKTFVHIDVAKGSLYPQNVIWTY